LILDVRPQLSVVAERRILRKNLRECELRSPGQRFIAADDPDLLDGLFAAVFVGYPV